MRRRLGRVGAAVTVWQIVTTVREHWLSIPKAERERAAELAIHSRLRPSNLSPAQRTELRVLISGMRLVSLGQRLAAVAGAKRRPSVGRRR